MALPLWNNSRFYLLASSVVVSVFMVAWFRVTIPSDQLFYIRTQQMLGLLSLVYWYAALMISPLTYVAGKQRLRHVVFMRRAIGVSAAYFALLHCVIALWGQLGGVSGLAALPFVFLVSLACGAAAMTALCAMALTSFDGVIRFITYKRWKWLHRITYLAFILVLLHIWTIGSHAAYSAVQLTALVALLVLVGLETYRTLANANKKWQFIDSKSSLGIMMCVVMIGWVSLLVTVPTTIESYHTRHHGGVEHDH